MRIIGPWHLTNVLQKFRLTNRAIRKITAAVLLPAFVICLPLGATRGARASVLTVTNGNFASYSGTAPGTSGDNFTNVNPTGWTGGGGLIFVTNHAGINNPSLYLNVYGPFPDSPLGGNFVEADGNPDYEGSFAYQLTGLTVGKTYSLSFFQAGGQQRGFANGLATTEQWIVGLGTTGISVSHSGGPTDPIYGPTGSYSMADPTGSLAISQLMTTPSGGVTPWQQVTVNLTADSSTDLLSFLAWGDKGSTINLPPIAFLDIAGNGAVVPEPSSLALWSIMILGFGAYRLRLRAKPAAI